MFDVSTRSVAAAKVVLVHGTDSDPLTGYPGNDIYQPGGDDMAIRKRQYADGNFRYVVDFYDQNGIRRRETLPEGTSKQAAKEKLKQYEDQVGKRVYSPEDEKPVFEKVADDWLNYKKPFVRASTWSVMDGHIRNHLSDFYGIKIHTISTAMIEKWIADKRAVIHIDTLRKVKVNLGQVFRYAVRQSYIAVNPMLALERITTGASETGDPDTEDDMQILNPDQIKALLAAVKNQKYRTLFMLAIFSGARQGELLGLKWSDILWEKNQIAINRTYNNQAFYDPKTKTSRRKIDLGSDMMFELKKWKLACPHNNLDLVFPNKAGKPMEHKNMVNRHFKPALEAAECPDIRFHDLRHTFASLKIHQGAKLIYIQQQMGHSKPTITLNIYSHLFDKSDSESAQGLENMIFGL